jgi:hypothetical protein
MVHFDDHYEIEKKGDPVLLLACRKIRAGKVTYEKDVYSVVYGAVPLRL